MHKGLVTALMTLFWLTLLVTKEQTFYKTMLLMYIYKIMIYNVYTQKLK